MIGGIGNSLGGGLAASLGGLQQAGNRLAQSAQKVASAGLPDRDASVRTEPVDLAAEAVEQTVATYDFKANLKAFQAQDRLQKEVIDILA